MEVITDAMTFQGHGLVNFSTANRLKFCKIKNPLRHTVKLSKLWKITLKGKNKGLVMRKTVLGLSLCGLMQSRNIAANKPKI